MDSFSFVSTAPKGFAMSRTCALLKQASLSQVARHWRLPATARFLQAMSHFHTSAHNGFLRSRHTGFKAKHAATRVTEKHSGCNRTFSVMTMGRLLAFENAGMDVAREFVQGEKIDDDVRWKREERLDLLAQELVELHTELQDALAAKNELSIAQAENSRVEHLGNGVYVQHNALAIDRDSKRGLPATITREESRSCVHHALDALQSEFAVAVTGQPGIGKTRGSMMYAIQALLFRRAAVLYVGYKAREMLLFLPREDGTYRVWSERSTNFDMSRFLSEERLVAIIDPPEDGPYSSSGRCRVLKFVSNNAEKHFRNWTKDGVLLVTSMPTEKEVVAMTRVLWNAKKTPHAWQMGEVNTLEEKITEIERRIELVGPIPRLVFDSVLFVNAIRECVQGVVEAAENVSDSDLYKALRGNYSTFLGKHPASVSSRLLLLNPQTVNYSTWEERNLYGPTFQLTPIAVYLLRVRLEKSTLALRKENFEDFAFDWLCETEGRRPEIQNVADGKHDAAYQRIASMNGEELRVYRLTASNFPFIDFATSSKTWYNAKSIGKEVSSVRIDEDGARKFLRNLEKCMVERNSPGGIRNIPKLDKPVLTVLTNGDVEPRLRKPSAGLKLFGELVNMTVVNISDLSALQLLNRTHRTKELVEELQDQLLTSFI